MKNNKLYDKIIRNISHSVKYTLNEELEKFNPADYEPNEQDILDQEEISAATHKYHPTSNEELKQIINKKLEKNPTQIDLSDIDVSRVTLFYRLFQNTELVYVDLSSWDMSNAVNMTSMFYGCSELRKVNLKGCDTSNVYDMSYMFFDCCKLNDIIGLEDLRGDTVKNFTAMFRNCKNLKEIDMSNFKSSPISVGYMFYGCTRLKSVKIGNIKGNRLAFSTLSPVEYIFNKCKNIEYIEISKSLNVAIVLNNDVSQCKYVLKNK